MIKVSIHPEDTISVYIYLTTESPNIWRKNWQNCKKKKKEYAVYSESVFPLRILFIILTKRGKNLVSSSELYKEGRKES